MQPTQDRLGVDGVRFSAAMARIGLWGLDMGERRIGETGAERHVRTAKIVVALGLRGGDFNTVTPSFPIDSSRCWAKILSRS